MGEVWSPQPHPPLHPVPPSRRVYCSSPLPPSSKMLPHREIPDTVLCARPRPQINARSRQDLALNTTPTTPYPTAIRPRDPRALTLSAAPVTTPESRVDKPGPLTGKLAGAPMVLDLCVVPRAPPAQATVSHSSRALSVPYQIAMSCCRGRVRFPSSQTMVRVRTQ
ncbi:hypothetical protein B0H14DRAFT_1104799 [Mycena olivaceomarginata]|nr:hypothetical protein B0H14DRAFT_1104799 [Mycena olivaceomarginata]